MDSTETIRQIQSVFVPSEIGQGYLKNMANPNLRLHADELLENDITSLSLEELVEKMHKANGLPKDGMLYFDKEDIVASMGN